jgi:hypothetical protein
MHSEYGDWNEDPQPIIAQRRHELEGFWRKRREGRFQSGTKFSAIPLMQ